MHLSIQSNETFRKCYRLQSYSNNHIYFTLFYTGNTLCDYISNKICVCMCSVSAQIIGYYYSPSRQQSTKCDISQHLMLSVVERKLGLAFSRSYHDCHVVMSWQHRKAITYFLLLFYWLKP